MPAAQHDAPNKIFVGNMPKHWTETKMEENFQKFGKIEEVSLMKNRESGESRGFGFISFVSADDASDAIAGMNGKEIEGNTLKVDAALKALHGGGRGGGPGGDRGRGRGRGDFRGGMRGRGGPGFRGGPARGGFGSRGGGFGSPPGARGGMDRGRGRGGSSRGFGRGGEGSMRGGPSSRGMGRGGEGSPRGGLLSRGRGGGGRPLIERLPLSQDLDKPMGRDSGFGRPGRGRSLLGKEPLLQAPSAPELDYPPAREPRGRPVERETDSYRNPLIRERDMRAPAQAERHVTDYGYTSERESMYGSRNTSRYGEESYGRTARDEYSTSRVAPEYAEARTTRSEYPEDPYNRRDPYAASAREVAPARSARDSYQEREYAPSSRGADMYGSAASSAASRGYASRETAMSRESVLGREAPITREYAPARPPARDYEARREEPAVRDYERTARAYPQERAAATYGREYDGYEKAASRGYGAETYGRAREPAGSAPSSRAAYSSRDQYASGRGDRAEKPAYDPYRSADPYRGRPQQSDRNGASLPSRPYSRY